MRAIPHSLHLSYASSEKFANVNIFVTQSITSIIVYRIQPALWDHQMLIKLNLGINYALIVFAKNAVRIMYYRKIATKKKIKPGWRKSQLAVVMEEIVGCCAEW